MPSRKDTALGGLAVERGFITQQQLDEALVNQRKMRDEMGIDQGLEPILVGKKWLSADQVHELRNAAAVQTGEARLVAGYEVVAKLGRGGMGAVYKARRLGGTGFVALKILPPSLANEAMIARFRRESEIVKKLQHENIVGCVEFGYDKRRKCHFCALELVEGEDLGKRLKRLGKLSEDEAVTITVQMAKALQHAYRNGLVHRDVKPENIMVTSDGTAKLLDLGLARQASREATRLTESGLFVGSPYYASPEQALGREELDIRADIYALGATLYHMVTGQPPFAGATQMAILQKHVSEKLPWPAEVNPDVSEGTCFVITKMMAKDPADRYQTPNDLHRDLDLLAAGKEPEAAKATAKSSVAAAARPRGRRQRRHPPERTKKARAPVDRHGARHKRRPPTAAHAPAMERGGELAPEGAPAPAQMKLAMLVGASLGALALVIIYVVHTSMRPEREPLPAIAPDTPRASGRVVTPAERPRPVAPAAPKKPGPDSARRAPPPAPGPGKRTAAAAFRTAERYEAAHPRDHAGAMALFRAVIRDFPGTFQAKEARLNMLRLGSVAGVKVELPREAPAPAQAPPDAIAFGGRAYKLFAEKMEWREAKSFCEEQGGHLVTITSKEENDFVTDLARERGDSAWLGLSDEREEGTWEWVTGEKAAFNAWAEGEPNNAYGAEDYAQLYAGGRYAWNDAGSKRPSLVICEWEPAAAAAKVAAAAPAGLARGLVGHWTFDEDEGDRARDASGKGNHGTIKGGAKWTKGKIGRALAFDGNVDFVQLPTAMLRGSSSLTYAAWVRAKRYTGNRWPPIIGGDTTSASRNVNLGIWRNAERLHVEVDTDTGNYATKGKIPLKWDVWMHVAMVYDGRTLREHVDGVQGGSIPASGRLKNLSVLHLGRTKSGDFNGLIDDVRIYNRALSGDEVKALASAAPAAGEPRIAEVAPPGKLPKEGLQIWFDAQDVDGDGKPDAFRDRSRLVRWVDKSGKGRDAVPPGPARSPVYTKGQAGGRPVARFDGGDDSMSFRYDPNGLTGMTIFVVSACAKDVETGRCHNERAAIWWGEKGGWGNVVVVPLQSAVGARFGTGQTGNMLVYKRPARLAAGKLTLTTTLHDGPAGTDYVYVDGTRVVAATGKRATLTHHDTTGHLGASAYGGAKFNTFFPGDIGEILVYNRTLPDAERRAAEAYLKQKWAIGGAGPRELSALDRGLVAYWKFDEGVGDTARDSSGRGSDAKVHGAARAEGRAGRALKFDGGADGSHAHVAAGPVDPGRSFTVAAWVFWNGATASNQTLVEKRSTGGYGPEQYNWGIVQKPTGKLCLPKSHGVGELDFGAGLVAGRWIHMAVTYNDLATTGALYLNGVLQKTGAYSSRNYKGKAPVRIGAARDNETGRAKGSFNGAIDEFRMYSRVLTAQEIRFLVRPEELAALDAKRTAKKAAAAEAARRQDAFERLLDEIDPLAERGDYAASRRRLEKAKRQPQSAAHADKLASALRVCKVLEDRAKAAAAGAKALVGGSAELKARVGRPRKGEVKEVTDAGIVLVTRYKIGTKEFEKPVTVGWPTLDPVQVDEFAGKGGWKAAGPDGAVARAYLALGREDTAGAVKALEQAGDHPLAAHLRRKLGGPAGKLPAKKVTKAVPGGWPSNRKGLVFAWEAAGKPVILIDPATGRARPCSLRVRRKAKMAGDGAMQLDEGAYLVEGADKVLLAACKATNALTIETAMHPRNLTQGGPARIISFSQDAQLRNFTLGQKGKELRLRLRTPLTGTNGSKPESRLCDLPKAGPCHVIVSYSPGRLVCYLNGKKVLQTDKVQGDFSNWEPMHFLFGDEWKDSRDWEGTLRGIAIYNRFMGEAEAAESFRKSPRPRPAPAAAKTKWTPIFNGRNMNGWTQHGGKAHVDNGALVAYDNADLLYRADWNEFVLDCEVRGEGFGLNLVHAGPGRGAPKRVNVVFHKDGDAHVRSGGKRLWKSGNGKFPLDQWTPVRLALSKAALKVYRGDKLIGKVDLPRAAAQKGGIYFYSHRGKAMIRKVRVRVP